MSPQGQGLCHHSVSHKHTHTLGQFELDPWLRPHTTHITKNKNCRGVIVFFFSILSFFGHVLPRATSQPCRATTGSPSKK